LSFHSFFVEAVVEVEELEMLELGARRGEQLLADANMRVHRAADVEQQQELHLVARSGIILISR